MAGAPVRRPSYKDVLQPALHRRFTATLVLLMGIAYLYAVFLAQWNSFLWTWFPIGPAGVRTAFLFSIVLVFVCLRIAQYHVGLRTSDSAFSTFLQHAVKLQTAEALFTYTVSGYIFSQIYLWSLPESAGLQLITYYLSDRARLNEKSIFFTAHFIILGIYQAVLHLWADKDRLTLGTAKPKKEGGNAVNNTHNGDTHWKRLGEQMPAILASSVNQSIVGIGISIVVYPLFLRSTVWRVMLFFLRPIYNLPRTNLLPASLPFSVYTLFRCFLAGYMLLLLLTVGNFAFSIFLAKEPLKNGKPLSSDAKDPNGALLNGLKSKKESIKAFAMWELAFIARDFPDRRKAIYDDIDRKDGPMWSQVYGICIEVLKSIESRIDTYGKPAVAATPAEEEKVEPKKRTTAPPKEDEIFTSTPPKPLFRAEVEKVVTNKTTAPGQGSQLSPIAKKAIASGKQSLLKVQKEVTGSDDPQSLFRDFALKVLNSAAGWPFRQEYRRRLAKAVLGEPYGEPSLYVNAASALSLLAAHSLTEDKYGNVQRDIAAIIRALTSVTKKLDVFREEISTHWTDVNAKRECPEVDEVVSVLKQSLGKLVEEFGPYARDLRLSLTDIRLAREAAIVTQRRARFEVEVEHDAEMREVR